MVGKYILLYFSNNNDYIYKIICVKIRVWQQFTQCVHMHLI